MNKCAQLENDHTKKSRNVGDGPRYHQPARAELESGHDEAGAPVGGGRITLLERPDNAEHIVYDVHGVLGPALPALPGARA